MAHGDETDNTDTHLWLFDQASNGAALTPSGEECIAHHKYKSGAYTALDSFLSPHVWEPLTNMLPLWLAPNLVTTIGGLFCLSSFLLSGSYLEDEDPLPPWLFVFNGCCIVIYYTFDCMDGKQARRTNSSSPLGQLFDHGMDCLCVLNHLRSIQCIVDCSPLMLLVVQTLLQWSFWQAQWEEYYTGILPHASGNIGVTETNYGIGLWSILTGVSGRKVYDKSLFSSKLISNVQVKDLFFGGWVLLSSTLIILSWIRVYRHIMTTTKKDKIRLFASAMSKFASPLLLSLVSLWGFGDSTYNHGSLSLGLCFCLITIKLIVYSMAKMAYAVIQYDIIPFITVVVFMKNNTVADVHQLFRLLDLFYLSRLLYWIHKAIKQLCKRLKIRLLRIPYDKKSN